MKRVFLLCALTLMACDARAQTPEVALATQPGSELTVGIASYTYREPDDHAISIHAPKLVAGYTGTIALSRRRRWFLQAQLRGTAGITTYDGWCSPFFIAPNNASPNGYDLRIGDPSPCSESGDSDWYAEGRALAGKDLIRERWGWSPYAGIGLRYLANGLTGAPDYRTDEYLYVPVGVTARTNVTSRRALALNIEIDALVHGWQKTRESELGGGQVPATLTAPAFTIDSFTDVSFSQRRGWAVRAGASYPITRRWSLQPYYLRWAVQSSAVNHETVAFTVNHVQAHEQLGAYEPYNVTNEFGANLGFRF